MRKIFTLCIAALSAISLMAAEGALSGKFTINADGDQIVFSKGNLQATTTNLGTNWTWTFAVNQWDCVSNETANNAISGNGIVSANGTVDLFGWSTADAYYGIHNSEDESLYSGNFVDWGATIGTGWRLLNMVEWQYLFYCRANHNNLYGVATVNNVPGYVLLPDDWTMPSGLTFQKGSVSFDMSHDALAFRGWFGNVVSNQYTVSEWLSMQNAGAVFLPIAGCRKGSQVVLVDNECGEKIGMYWMSPTPKEDGNGQHNGEIEEDDDYYDQKDSHPKSTGQSVRLVMDYVPTATNIRYVATEAKPAKYMENGQLFILRDGRTYNAQGQEVE